MATPTKLKKTIPPAKSFRIAGLIALLIAAQGAVGWWVYSRVETSLKTGLAEDLRTILNAEVQSVKLWFEYHETAVDVAAQEPRVREAGVRLLELAQRPEIAPEAVMSSRPMDDLREFLGPLLRANNYKRFGVFDTRGLIIVSDGRIPESYSSDDPAFKFILQVFDGRTVVSRPFRSAEHAGRGNGQPAGEPAMFAAAPLRAEDGRVIGGLGFGLRPEDFSRLLRVARAGESGETYAFDAEGLLISDSRFEKELSAMGILPADASGAALTIVIRDPGGDMMAGFRPHIPRAQLPLTRMAAEAVQGTTGFDVDGYRDYRGVQVVGAWTWLPKYGFGVTTEKNRDEAYESLNQLRSAFWALIGLLAVSALAILVGGTVIGNLSRRVRRAQRLGQYTLEKKLGEGGMGAVYRARHALLRRPTAVKLLRPDVSSGENIARFEREVQLTSQLTHPNTIEIYDYGHTPDGLFYYAMEYLPGITLELLTEEHGPQAEGRVIHILTQACGSLAEAHRAGIIHRDIKPSNIMLCERGGVYDTVKVLDFGLVKEVSQGGDMGITAVDTITGTPLYLSPEAIRSPDQLDARGDIYALGAVGYYLLTGEHVFMGATAIEVFSHHLTTEPDRPSDRVGREISKDLEALILRCLEKDRDKRPSDAESFLTALERCADSGTWTHKEAREWWSERLESTAGLRQRSGLTTDSGDLSETFAVALEDR